MAYTCSECGTRVPGDPPPEDDRGLHTIKPNPCRFAGKWYWYDEKGKLSRAFETQADALYDLLKHMRLLGGTETAWEWLRRKLSEFWHDTRGAS